MTNPWDECFDRQEYVYGTRPNAFIQSVLPSYSPVCDVLAIAEGEGRNAVYAAELGHRVTAWDYSSVGLDKMERLADSRNVQVKTELVDLAQDIAYQEHQWDVVINVFGHIGDETVRQKLMNDVQKMMRPGGAYIMEVSRFNFIMRIQCFPMHYRSVELSFDNKKNLFYYKS